jgi:DNA-binding PadR family transcriptional regulator
VSTLGYALLSLLTRGPATGYELSQRMRRPIGHFWTAKHSQVYPELAQLTAQGWVSVTEGEGPGPRAKKTYELTEDGRGALGAWLVQPPVSQPRSEVTLKAYAINSADPQAAAALYEQVAAEAAVALAEFEAEEAVMREAGMDGVAHPRFGNYAVLRMGIESQRALHAWAAWLAGRIRSGT